MFSQRAPQCYKQNRAYTVIIPPCCVDGIFKMFYSSEHQLRTAVQKQAGSAFQGLTAWAVILPGLSLLELNCQKGRGCHVLAAVSWGLRFVCWVFFFSF